jgi:hypothetical protein
MTSASNRGREHDVVTTPAPGVSEWGGAALRAALILVLSFVGFVIVPDRLLAFLATRVEPMPRDALVLLWVVAFFVVLTRTFVALQRREPT